MVDTCALMDIRTSQAMDRSRRHHTLQFTFMSHRSTVVVLWKTLGSGAQFSIGPPSLSLPPPALQDRPTTSHA